MRRLFNWLAVGLFGLVSFLVVPTAANADTSSSTAVLADQQSIRTQDGCEGTTLPEGGRLIRVKDGFYVSGPEGTACKQCDAAALAWARQGYGTWCWETSEVTAELWIGPIFANGKLGGVERVSMSYSAKEKALRDPWYVFDHYPNQGACEADRAHGVSIGVWTWERSQCATNNIDWVLLIDYGSANAPKGKTAALATTV